MKIAKMISRYISIYGEAFFLTKTKATVFKGVLQPTFSGEYITDSAGFAGGRKYRVYIEANDKTKLIKEGDRFANDSKEFAISQIEPFTLCGSCVYLKAIASLVGTYNE